MFLPNSNSAFSTEFILVIHYVINLNIIDTSVVEYDLKLVNIDEILDLRDENFG